jgi:uncharacterized protein YjbI with pentapeptide repeats
MANDEHVALLKKGVDAWNVWRRDQRNTELIELAREGHHVSGPFYLSRADVSHANLVGANLEASDFREGNLSGANLSKANLLEAHLHFADLSEANLVEANLAKADLFHANLSMANLVGACLVNANLQSANLSKADLRFANLGGVELDRADLSGANLSYAHLAGADLSGANLSGACLVEASLRGVSLVDTDLTGADLTGCRIYGVSAWGLKLDRTKQQNLVITDGEPKITVDNIEVAQFVYLMLNNQKVRDVIDTITSKAVLILGRFTAERKAVLDAVREELRKRDYLPILFDFNVPATRDITETVSLLARMARFIIADLTDPSSIPKELEAVVPGLAVPVQPLLEGASRPYAMFKDYWKYDWVLPVYRYEGLEPLVAKLAEKVIAPAEGKVKALEERRRIIEAELTKPQ